MESEVSYDEQFDQPNRVSLCDTLKEILQLICCYHYNNEGSGGCVPNTDWILEFSIQIKKKSEKTKGDLDIFTMKVRCNQHVPMMSLLQELKTSKLIDFVAQMQRHEEESHLAIRLLDKDDSSLMRTFVPWISHWKDGTQQLEIQEETSKRTNPTNEKLLLQLRIFLSASILEEEVQSMSRFLCCLKMINPLVSIYLWLEGISGEELDLRNQEYSPCGSLKVSTDSTLYNHKALLTDSLCEGDMSLSKAFYANVEGTSTSLLDVACGLIVVPKRLHNNSQYQMKPSRWKPGEIYLQIYDSNRQPLDMLEFCLHLQITPDILIPLDDFRSVIRIVGTNSISPYNMSCSVKLKNNGSLPQFLEDCDRFTMWLCFVVNQDLSSSDSISSDVLNSLKKSVHLAFQKCLPVDAQKGSNQELVHSKNEVDDGDSTTKRWITDIATTLSDIYIKSTDISFRAQVAQMVPVHTCMSMKSYLKDGLETLLLPGRGSNVVGASNEKSKEQCDAAEDDDWKELSLSQFSCNEDPPQGGMSPDSLEDDTIDDQEWNEMTHQSQVVNESPCIDDNNHSFFSQSNEVSNSVHTDMMDSDWWQIE